MKAVAAFLLVLGCLAVSHAWKCGEGPRLNGVKQIDAGMGMVVATSKAKRAYFLSGRGWYRLGTNALKHVTVGAAGTWGCDARNKVYKFVAGNFKSINGLSMQQVDAGGDGQVVGVRPSSNYAYCMREVLALVQAGFGRRVSWSYLKGHLKYFSCGPATGCWGVNKYGHVYLAWRLNPTSCRLSRWVRVKAIAMKMIEVGSNGMVFGVSTTGKIYQRIGITARAQQGRSWRMVPMCMNIKHVSYDLRRLWAVTASGMVMKCTH